MVESLFSFFSLGTQSLYFLSPPHQGAITAESQALQGWGEILMVMDWNDTF